MNLKAYLIYSRLSQLDNDILVGKRARVLSYDGIATVNCFQRR